MRSNSSASKAEKTEAKYDVSLSYPNLELHSASASGNVGLVHYALTHGQPVNSVLHGVLPLHAACSGGSEQVVRMLIDRGADVNAPRLPRRYSDARRSAPSVGHSGSTPLHFAAANGHVRICRILLACGAVHDKADKHGHTPLALAEANNHVEVVELLDRWETLLEDERERVREEIQEEVDLGEVGVVPDAVGQGKAGEEGRAEPTRSRWKGKGKMLAHSNSGSSTKSEKVKNKKSLEGFFHSRRNSIAETTVDEDTPYSPNSPNLDRPQPNPLPPHIQAEGPGARRGSLPSIFERAAHPGASLRAALRKSSHTGSTQAADLQSFRGRIRSKETVDSASIASSGRFMSKTSLLNLFSSRGHGPNGSPPSASPSPPRQATIPLNSDQIDDEIERIRRASEESSRPGSRASRRVISNSHLNLPDGLAMSGMDTQGPWSAPADQGGFSGSRDSSTPSLVLELPQSADAPLSSSEIALNSPEVDQNPDLPAQLAIRSLSSLSDRSEGNLSALGVSSPGRRPRNSSEVAVSSPLANEWNDADDERPTSMLRKRASDTKSARSPRSAQGSPRQSPWSSNVNTPSTTKPRSATLPSSSSYFPAVEYHEGLPRTRAELLADATDPPQSEQISVVATDDLRHTSEIDDVVAENIWERASNKGPRSIRATRSRGASFTSISSSTGSPKLSPRISAQDGRTGEKSSYLSVNNATSPMVSDKDDSPPSSTVAKGRSPSSHLNGRDRNKSVSSTSSSASAMAFSTVTYGTSYTPPSVASANLPGSGSMYEEGSGPSRRGSKKQPLSPTFMYTIPSTSVDAGLPRPPSASRVSTRAEAHELVKQTENQIVQAVSTPDWNDAASFSLAATLAAYGDSLALEEQLANADQSVVGEGDIQGRPPTRTSEVSRSYIHRPDLIKADSAESQATVTDDSGRSERAAEAARRRTKPTDGRSGTSDSQKGSSIAGFDARSRNVTPMSRAKAPEPLFLAEAPPSSIPSINRIYENRAAAYRDRGKALIKTAPIINTTGRNRSSSGGRNTPISDHWVLAGSRQGRAESLRPEGDRPSISLPMQQTLGEASEVVVKAKGRESDLRFSETPRSAASASGSAPRLPPLPPPSAFRSGYTSPSGSSSNPSPPDKRAGSKSRRSSDSRRASESVPAFPPPVKRVPEMQTSGLGRMTGYNGATHGSDRRRSSSGYDSATLDTPGHFRTKSGAMPQEMSLAGLGIGTPSTGGSGKRSWGSGLKGALGIGKHK